MTNLILSAVLVFQPVPVAPGHAPGSEGVRLGTAAVLHPLTAAEPAPDYWKDYQPWQSRVVSSAPIPATSPPPFDLLISMEAEPVGSAPTPTAVSSVSSDPPPSSTTASLTLRERALNRFAELGATSWQIGVFDCIGWQESKWQNVRSATADDGTLQINDIHDPQLRAEGLDPYVPEDAATFSWELSRQGTRFTPWSVHARCGV